ncbi:MAG: hypothetical protein V3V14_00500 [Saprospiraceae bacterium]
MEYLDPTIPISDTRFLHLLRIKPSGTGIVTDSYFCNNRPQKPNISGCTPAISTADILIAQDNLNTMYNKVNINFTINYMGVKYLNYDLEGKDDDNMDTKEQRWVHISLYGDNFSQINNAPNIQTWIVPTITQKPKTAFGAATIIGNLKTLSVVPQTLISSSPIFKWRTLAHEIGHAVFNLRHPDDDPGSKLPDPQGDGLKNTNSMINTIL